MKSADDEWISINRIAAHTKVKRDRAREIMRALGIQPGAARNGYRVHFTDAERIVREIRISQGLRLLD